MSTPDSSANSSTTPSTKLNTVKFSDTAFLNPNKAILKFCVFKELTGNVSVLEDKSKVEAKLGAPTLVFGSVIVLEDKSKVDVKSPAATVLSDNFADVTALLAIAGAVTASVEILLETIEASFKDLFVNLVFDPIPYFHCRATPCILTVLLASSSFHFIDWPLGCPDIVAVPVKILWPALPVT